MKLRNKTVVAALALATAAAVGAGIARSTTTEPIPDANGVIHACYKKPIGPARIVYSAANCARGEAPLEWNAAGVPGPQGPQGAEGPPGPHLSGSVVYHLTDSSTINPGNTVGGTYLCPFGSIAIGGAWNGGPGIDVYRNQPGPTPRQWEITVQNAGSQPTVVDTYNVCLTLG